MASTFPVDEPSQKEPVDDKPPQDGPTEELSPPAANNVPASPHSSSSEDVHMQILQSESSKLHRVRIAPPLEAPVPVEGILVAAAEPEDFEKPAIPSWENTPAVCSFLTWARTLACIGVIFGDIGTSPLYTIESIYCNPDCFTPTPEDAKGILSNMIWSLIVVTSIKYLIILFTCTHQGEGGIFALLSLLKATAKKEVHPWVMHGLVAVAAFGSCALIADGVITPALSVLSAVSGLEDPRIAGNQTNINNLTTACEWITIGLLLLLFIAQFVGTGKVGLTFGPGCLVYFIAIGGIGVYNMAQYGTKDILEGWSPHYAVKFWVTGTYSGASAFQMFSSIVLVVTGSEATYADCGHFGRPPVMLAWFFVALPCLILNYTGQMSYALANDGAISNLYFNSIPDSIYVPTLIFSLFATLVASQAMISGCFSLISQAIHLDLFPPIRVKNTDAKLRGQVFVPMMNLFLGVLTICFVLGFQTSAALANAYGMAVLIAFNCTTVLLTAYLYYCVFPTWPLIAVIGLLSPIIFVDATFLASTLTYKLSMGGWAPLLIAFVLATVMLVWRTGQSLSLFARAEQRQLRSDEQNSLDLMSRVTDGRHSPGMFFFMTTSDQTADVPPLTLSLFMSMTGTTPETVVLLRLDQRTDVAFVDEKKRLRLLRRGDSTSGVYIAVISYGYGDVLSPEVLLGLVNDIVRTIDGRSHDEAWFVVQRNSIEPDSSKPGWLLRAGVVYLYSLITILSPGEESILDLPNRRVVQLGSHLQL